MHLNILGFLMFTLVLLYLALVCPNPIYKIFNLALVVISGLLFALFFDWFSLSFISSSSIWIGGFVGLVILNRYITCSCVAANPWSWSFSWSVLLWGFLITQSGLSSESVIFNPTIWKTCVFVFVVWYIFITYYNSSQNFLITFGFINYLVLSWGYFFPCLTSSKVLAGCFCFFSLLACISYDNLLKYVIDASHLF